MEGKVRQRGIFSVGRREGEASISISILMNLSERSQQQQRDARENNGNLVVNSEVCFAVSFVKV